MKLLKEFQYSVIFTTFLFCNASSFAASFKGIGFLPDGLSSTASDVSGDGSIIVGNSTNNYPGGKAFCWKNGVMTELPRFSNTEHDQEIAYSISYDGSVIAGQESIHAVIWQDGIIQGLDMPVGYCSLAGGLSSDGSVVVGMRSLLDNIALDEPFKWENGVTTGLGYLHEGDTFGGACDVSADGKIIVGFSGHVGISEAFMWQDGIMTGLGSLIPDDPFSLSNIISSAASISADGTVIVGVSHQAAVKWKNGEIAWLGMLPQSFASMAVDVSADGKIIVGYCNCDDEAFPFIWDEANGMQNLQDLLVGTYDLDLTGWRLLQANAISADGTTIVGSGIDPDGNYQGWVATIPEPATLLFFSMGLLTLKRQKK